VIRERLERVIAQTDHEMRLSTDPVAFVHRYESTSDREIAAVVASSLAYGRVGLFRVVLDDVFAEMDRHGGPSAYIDSFAPATHAHALRNTIYRWTRGVDFVLLFAALRRVLERKGSLGAAFPYESGTVQQTLDLGVGAVRTAVLAVAPECGLGSPTLSELPRGIRHALPVPSSGSACKRWCMFLRWMVRPADGIDLGVWTHIPRHALVIPLDTHVMRISGFIGLTDRKTASWRTAEQITAALAVLDPEDPVRFDFALAHLGISGACRGHRDEAVCPSCPLEPVCRA
jgi:uncharacterized protein (TIGR02757 family)